MNLLKNASIGLALTGLGGMLGVVPAHATAILSDGDFTTDTPSDLYTPTSGTFGGGAWTVDYGTIDQINGYWQSPPAGGNSVDMSGDSPGAISQTLNTVTDETYTLDFYLAGNPDGDPQTKDLYVYVGDPTEDIVSTVSPSPAPTGMYMFTVPQTVPDENLHSDMGWTLETLTFTATGPTTNLEFAVPNDPSTYPSNPNETSYGPAVGGINVAVAPEPAQMAVYAFVALGLGGLMLRARRAQAIA